MKDVVAEIRERWGKATPGPWSHGYADGSGRWNDGEGASINAPDEEDARGPAVVVWGGRSFGSRFGVAHEADAEAIAHAPEDIDTLCSLVEKYREALRFYADPKMWERDRDRTFGADDGGDTARQALGEHKEES